MRGLLVLLFAYCMSQVNAERRAAVVGCTTGEQAKILNQEIISMLQASSFVDLLTTYSENIASQGLMQVEKCLEQSRVLYKVSCLILESVGQDGSAVMKQFEEYKKSELLGFKNAYERILNPIIQDAQIIESRINEGNKRRQIQLEIVTRFKETWLAIRRIRQEHEKTLQSMDVFLKDSITRKSAEIGQFIREGNAGNKWSATSVKRALRNIDEINDVDDMISVYASVLSSGDIAMMHNEFVENYVTSQVAFALRKTNLENTINSAFRGGREAERIQSFSELITSKSINKTAMLVRDGLSVGYENAQKYTTSVNSSVEALVKGFGNLDSVSMTKNCLEVKKISMTSATIFATMFRVFHEMGPSQAAYAYNQDIEKFYNEQILPAMNTHSVQAALRLILRCLPQNKNEKVEESFLFLTNFASNPLGGGDINTFNKTMEKVAEYTENLLDGFRCYRKIFQVIGNIVQDCKDGRKSFDDLYTEHFTKAELDSSICTDMALIGTPTKQQIQQMVNVAAKNYDFNANCQQNQQNDEPGFIYYSDTADYSDGDDDVTISTKLSASQRFMVCDLRKKSKKQSAIAQMIQVSERLVGGVRCKQA